MEDFRSKSYNGSRMQIEAYGYEHQDQQPKHQDFRCHSASYASSSQTHVEPRFKKGINGYGSAPKGWAISDPELQRKKRVAGYKVYTVEGKVKGSIKRSFRWIKDKYSHMVYGLRS